MGKKRLDIEFVKEQFENEGYELLSEEYIGCEQKLGYICPEGHKHSITWNMWQRGQRCPCFAGRPPINIDFVRLEFAKEGYILLTKKYINAHQKLDYVCPKGHRHFITWNKWQVGKRCRYCAGNAKLTIEFIRSEFKKEGYQLLTKKYINNEQKLDYICPKGHKHSMAWTSWISGCRCVYCSKRPPISLEFVRSEFTKENYILLSDEYINAQQKLLYICSKGHKHFMTWNDWQQGTRCYYCSKERFLDESWLEKFSKACRVKPNKVELILKEFLDKLLPKEYKYVGDFKFWVSGKNPDFVHTSENKIIELFGNYWHSEKITGMPEKVHEKELVDHYKNSGFETLIVWEKELKNLDDLKERINNFNYN